MRSALPVHPVSLLCFLIRSNAIQKMHFKGSNSIGTGDIHSRNYPEKQRMRELQLR
jgi:hypothetical protein